jgi:glucoamylase
MHLPLLISLFAVANRVAANQFPGIKHTSNTRAVHDYLDRLAPASKNAILHELMGPTVGSDVSSHLLADHPMRLILTNFLYTSTQPGVIVPVVPDPEHPEYTAYWVRDGCRIYHTWLNELTVPGPHDDTKLLRALVDDGVHALIRTQQVVSLSGNVFTGGLEEPAFDIHLDMLSDPAFRIGSPAAGANRLGVSPVVEIKVQFLQTGHLFGLRS